MQTPDMKSPDQLLYIAQRLLSQNKEDAAESAGVSIEDVIRWEKDPEFVKVLSDIYAEHIELAKARVQQTLVEAVTVHRELLKAVREDGRPDNTIREKAVRLSYDVSGMLNKKSTIEANGDTIQIVLDSGDL